MSIVSSFKKAYIAAIIAASLNAILAAVNIAQYVPKTQFPIITQIAAQLESHNIRILESSIIILIFTFIGTVIANSF